MRFKLPPQFVQKTDLSKVLSDVLRNNGLNPSVVVLAYPTCTIIEIAETNLSNVRAQLKAAVIANTEDSSTLTDITV